MPFQGLGSVMEVMTPSMSGCPGSVLRNSAQNFGSGSTERRYCMAGRVRNSAVNWPVPAPISMTRPRRWTKTISTARGGSYSPRAEPRIQNRRCWRFHSDARSYAGKKIIFENAPDRVHAVAPADFFALQIGAAMVGNGHFENAQLHARHFRGDFRLETEPAFLDVHFLNHFPAKRFVAGLHVGEVQVGRHVGQGREKSIANRMPIIQHAMFLRADEPRAEYDVCLAFEHGADHAKVFRRIIFEVGVLNDDIRRSHAREPRPQSRAFALVHIVAKQ